MNDNDILRAWELCKQPAKKRGCENCPYHSEATCTTKLITDNINLINRLKAENERLTARNFELSEKGEKVCIALKTAKTEAYKEFAEILHCHSQSIINQEWNKKVYPHSWADAYEEFDNVVNNTLTELVGEG